MRASDLPQIYRNVNRWREIVTVLSKYGLADWISRLNLEFAKGILKSKQGEALARHSQEERTRMALTELGPTFIKLGQMLSTRADVIGTKLAGELRRLQANVPADKPEAIRETIEKELGRPIDEMFSEFDDEPLASASIAQVHGARLHSGEQVVVKVQHRGIESTVREDTEILVGLATLAERLEEFSHYRPASIAEEFQRSLKRELDFARERRNLDYFREVFASHREIHVPRTYAEHSSARVLTMERIEGIKLSRPEELKAAGVDLDQVARRGARVYLKMIFEKGVYHADPHPGNIVLLPNNEIGLLDFGNVGRIDDRLRERIESVLIGIATGDSEMVASVIIRVGLTPPDLDEAALRTDVIDFVSYYGSQSLDRLDLSGALNELTDLIYRYKITLPPQVAMLLKLFVTLEGTAKLISPKFNLIDVIKPFRENIVMRRLSPKRQFRKLRKLLTEIEELVEVLPRRTIEILEQARRGTFSVNLDHRGLQPSVNRLVFGMITSALFLGSALMLSLKVPPVLFHAAEGAETAKSAFLGLQNVSILGMAGLITSVALGLWLLRAIAKSGHLD
jgi:ubiquinone biosynthesis protein